MPLRIYDTLTATKKTFEPLGSPVKVYFCGLTPKNYIHLGHAKLVVSADMMRRYLRHKGYDVLYVQNFTDIDDKTIAKAHEEGVTVEEIARKYTDAYFEGMDALNCLRAARYPMATAAIPGIIKVVEGLIAKGYGYAVEGNVYYRVDRFADYGRLSKRGAGDNRAGAGLRARGKDIVADVLEDEEAGVPVQDDAPATTTGLDETEQAIVTLGDDAADAVDEAVAATQKEHPRDFALWKASKPGEPAWDSPWGPGRPAWHIECSTMIFEELGQRIDIHGGGQDLIFPHHENEIAQSEAFSGEAPFANFWTHIAPLNVVTPDGENQKMAHSLGNFMTVRFLLQFFEPAVIRLYLLSQHYRSPITFDLSTLADVRSAWERLRAVYANMALLRAWAPYRETPEAEPVDIELNKSGRRLRAVVPAARIAFTAGMDDDFNTAQAVAALYDVARELNRFKDTLVSPDAMTPSARGVVEIAFRFVEEIMDVLGLPAPDSSTGADAETTTRVEALLAERERLREARDFSGADGVRDALAALGVVVEDHPQGKVWRKLAERGAVIFDMDGLLVDTEPLAFGATSRILHERYNVTLPHEVMVSLVGHRADECWARLRELYGVRETDAELDALQEKYYGPLLRDQSSAMPGARALVMALHALDIPLAIASSSPLWQIETVIERMDLGQAIRTYASGHEVARGKPAPDVYLLAAKRLGVDPRYCVALEDSGPGTAAAANAGMAAVSVPTPDTASHDFTPATLILPTLSGAATTIAALVRTAVAAAAAS